MKRIFLAILAVAALAACNKSEVVESAPSAEIAFDDVFVDNATKAADLTASNLADFGVYGTVAKNGQSGPIFENQKVQNSGTGFIYSPAQYWVPSAEYTFSAIAPYQAGDDATWTYDAATAKITFHNDIAQANQDLLFAYAERETEASITSKPVSLALHINESLNLVIFLSSTITYKFFLCNLFNNIVCALFFYSEPNEVFHYRFLVHKVMKRIFENII